MMQARRNRRGRTRAQRSGNRTRLFGHVINSITPKSELSAAVRENDSPKCLGSTA